MFPWNYGFHFGAASYIFLGAFYTVLVVVATTVLKALWRKPMKPKPTFSACRSPSTACTIAATPGRAPKPMAPSP